jgi:hypothetical protein
MSDRPEPPLPPPEMGCMLYGGAIVGALLWLVIAALLLRACR